MLDSILLLLFVTPVGWGILILVVIGAIIGIFKMIRGIFRRLFSSEYRLIPEDEKRERYLKGLSGKSL